MKNTTHSTTAGNGRFQAYEVSLELIRTLRPLLPRLERSDRDLAKQLRRAASSAALNLAEGGRRLGKDRVHHFSIASGSAREVLAAAEVAAAWGYLPERELQPVNELLDRLLAMVWRLSHPHPA